MKAILFSLGFAATLSAQQPAPAPAPVPAPARPEASAKKSEDSDDDKKEKSDKVKKDGKSAEGEPAKKKSMVEVLKKCDETKGLFTIHRDRETGTAYLFIKKKQLEKEYIYFSHTVDGVVGAGRHRGQFEYEAVFVMKKNYEKIEFVQQNTSFYFDPEHPLARAAGANISHGILAAEPIVAENEKGYLVNAGNLFLKEALRQVKSTPGKDEKNPLLGKLSDTKTKFTKLKSFPKNTLFTVEYVYENPSPPQREDDDDGKEDVTDERNISIVIQHTLIAMPKNDYQPRHDDPRVGYFMTELTDQTSTEVTPFRDFIHRWDLQKKDPAAALSEPVTPIVWWLENTTPLEYRDTIKAAVLMWNQSFEKIGFKNVIVVEQQPDDAKWDADDIQYNVLRWTSSPRPPFGGYGPSFVNPRTGQILGADIMLEFAYVKNRVLARRLWDEVGLASLSTEQGQMGDSRACMAGNFTQQGLLYGHQMLRLRKADTIEFGTLMKEAMTHLILHEVGHTLGLNHNFRASQLHTPAEMLDRAVTEKTGLANSVMDYMPLNLAPEKAKQGQYYTDAPGLYDDWAIAYGYSAALPDAEAEAKRLTALVSRSAEPELAFANDADDMRSPGKAIDPRAMVGDMSNDAIAYATSRCEITQRALGKLLTEYPKEDESYQGLTQAYVSLTTDVSNSLTTMSRYIGGVYVERAFVGQVKENPPQPLRPVEAEKQKAAMQALTKYAFGPGAWATPEKLLVHLQQQRRGFNFKSTGEDPKLHERVLKIQRALLDHLLHTNTQNRILDSALYGNAYLLPEMMQDLSRAIMDGEAQGAEISTVRQNLQLEYVDRLLGIVKSKNIQGAGQSVALKQLRTIEASLKGVAGNVPPNSRAHVDYVLYKIDKGLDVKG